MMKNLALVLFLIVGLWAIPNASANAATPMRKNSCDLYLQVLRSNSAVVRYAKTGTVVSKKHPVRSRAWYMAALGLHSLLSSYLKTHHGPKQFSDLLSIATYTGQKDTVSMLLTMGANPNQPDRLKDVLPLQYAAGCGRPIITLYLLQAGANVYGTTQATHGFAMAAAIVGPWLNSPFIEGVKLMLASGFDPRCPMMKNGVTASEAVRNGLRHAPNSKELRTLRGLIDTAVKISATTHPQRPQCGGMNWWQDDHQDPTRFRVRSYI